MSTKSKKLILLVTVLITIASMLAACGAPQTEPPAATQEPATEAPATEEPTEAPATEAPATGEATEAPATEAPAGEGAPYTIGISNPFISSEYRTQMIEELIAVNQEYMDQGLTTELVIESADTDVAGQIQQLQNLIAQDVDAILVNPGDVSGLNATLQEALDAGIIVISVDQELDVEGVYNVGIDQKEWAKTSAQWLAEKLGGVDYKTGKLTYTLADTKCGSAFLAFLIALVTAYAGRKIRLVCDNGRFHTKGGAAVAGRAPPSNRDLLAAAILTEPQSDRTTVGTLETHRAGQRAVPNSRRPGRCLSQRRGPHHRQPRSHGVYVRPR